jgi:hypothetical protein
VERRAQDGLFRALCGEIDPLVRRNLDYNNITRLEEGAFDALINLESL